MKFFKTGKCLGYKKEEMKWLNLVKDMVASFPTLELKYDVLLYAPVCSQIKYLKCKKILKKAQFPKTNSKRTKTPESVPNRHRCKC